MTRLTLKSLNDDVQALRAEFADWREQRTPSPTVGTVLRNSASSAKATIGTNFQFFITNVLYKLLLWSIVLYGCYHLIPTISHAFRGNSVVIPATELLMSEPEARLTFSAMEIIAEQINSQAIQDTATATEALRAELPEKVQELVVREVQRNSDGTIQQYPTAMEKTRRRIMIRR